MKIKIGFKTPEIKKFLINSIIIYLIIMIMVTLVFIVVDSAFRTRLMERDAAALAYISTIDSPNMNDFSTALNSVRTIDSDEIDKILSETGFDKRAYSDTFVNFNKITSGYFLVFILLFSASFFVIIIMQYRILRDNLVKTSIASKIAAASEELFLEDLLPENSEGIYPTLYHNINMMIIRQHHSEETLIKEKEFLKNLVSDISHQMKTPLSSLILNNELLLNMYPDNELLTVSHGQLNRMEVLVVNLLKYARLEAESVLFTPDRDSLELTISNAIKTVRDAAGAKLQKIKYTKNNSIKFEHDGIWLEEAIINIIKNSVEHVPEGGIIKVTETSTGLSINIIIEDDGPGIPEDEIPYIFNRFYKGKSGTNPINIGIGLSLSRLIIEGIGGAVRVENVASGGARFIISFPTY